MRLGQLLLTPLHKPRMVEGFAAVAAAESHGAGNWLNGDDHALVQGNLIGRPGAPPGAAAAGYAGLARAMSHLTGSFSMP